MQFLIVTRRRSERFSEAEFAARADAEAERARALYLAGFIRQIWYRGDQGGACIMAEAESIDAVREQLASLPMVSEEMLEVVALIPLRPYGGFGPRAA